MNSEVDGKYSRRAWDEEPEWSYTGPFAAYQERMIQQALATNYMSHDEIAAYVQTPLPQVSLFRPRDGYPSYQERQAEVDDIVVVSRMIQTNSTWYSGGPAGIDGGPRYTSNNLGLV